MESLILAALSRAELTAICSVCEVGIHMRLYVAGLVRGIRRNGLSLAPHSIEIRWSGHIDCGLKSIGSPVRTFLVRCHLRTGCTYKYCIARPDLLL